MIDETVMFARRDCGPADFLAVREYFGSAEMMLPQLMKRIGCYLGDWIMDHKAALKEFGEAELAAKKVIR